MPRDEGAIAKRGLLRERLKLFWIKSSRQGKKLNNLLSGSAFLHPGSRISDMPKKFDIYLSLRRSVDIHLGF